MTLKLLEDGIPIAPAVVNAVNHALDTNITTLPLTPERIVRGIR